MDCTASSAYGQAKTTVVLPSADRLRRPRPVPVLIVVHPDQFIEVYGPDGVRPVVVNRLDSCADPLLVDEYLESQIPRSHRGIHLPEYLKGTGNVERQTAEDEINRLTRLSLLKRIGGVGR